MQPLKAILVGVGEADAVRNCLQSRSIPIEATVVDPAEAIAQLANRPRERRVFLVELPAADLAGLNQLKTAFPDQPIVALLPHSVHRDAVMQAMRAGAVQVVLLPDGAKNLGDELGDDLDAHLGAALDSLTTAPGPSKSAPALAIAVSEISPGVEGAALAFNLAYEIGHLYRKPCVLAETWQRISCVPTYLNLKPRFDADDLIQAGERVDLHMLEQVLVRFSENLALLAGPSDLKSIEVNVSFRVKALELARQLAEVIVLEVPARFNEAYFQLLKTMDRVVLVGKQSLASVQNLRKARDTLRSEHGIQKTHLVVNGYDAGKVEIPLDGMREILGADLITVADPGNAMFRALEKSRALRQEDARSPALADLDALACRLIGEEPAVKVERRSGFSGWLSRVFGG